MKIKLDIKLQILTEFDNCLISEGEWGEQTNVVAKNFADFLIHCSKSYSTELKHMKIIQYLNMVP